MAINRERYRDHWCLFDRLRDEQPNAQGLATGNFSSLYSQPPPTWTRTGAVRAFFQRDLKLMGSELYVINDHKQSKMFNLSDFSGLPNPGGAGSPCELLCQGILAGDVLPDSVMVS